MPLELSLDEPGRWEVAVFASAERTHFVEIIDGLEATVVGFAGAGENETLGRTEILHEGAAANPYRVTVRSQREDGTWAESLYRASFDDDANRHVIETDDSHGDSPSEDYNDCTIHIWQSPKLV